MPTFSVPPPLAPSRSSASQVLEHVLDLLATPDAWCKGAAERTTRLAFTGPVRIALDDGTVVGYDAGDLAVLGVERCLGGAVRRALLDTGHLRTDQDQTGGRILAASAVAWRVARAVADAIRDRPPYNACPCSACTDGELPGETAVIRFNDHWQTTHDHVLEVLKDARAGVLDAELAPGGASIPPPRQAW
jgi:hypothetical protein